MVLKYYLSYLISSLNIHSINIIEKNRIMKSSDLLPNANKTPKGKAIIIPKKVSMNVKVNPPHTLVSTRSRPNPPFIKAKPINGKINIKKNKI